MFIEKCMRKAQIMIDHIDVGVPHVQHLAHLGEAGKKSTKMAVETSEINLKFHS